MLRDLTPTQAARREPLATKTPAEQGKPPRRKKTADKQTQKIARAKSATRPPRKSG